MNICDVREHTNPELASLSVASQNGMDVELDCLLVLSSAAGLTLEIKSVMSDR